MQRNENNHNITAFYIPAIKFLSDKQSLSPLPKERSYYLNISAGPSVIASASTNVPNDFIDKHKTFYNGLFNKMPIDTNENKKKKHTYRFVKRATSDDSARQSMKMVNNSSIDYVRMNIDKVIKKPQAKNYQSLIEEENRRRGLDPRKMIRALEELNQRIERNFDRKTGALRVPQSINEWRKEVEVLKTKSSKPELKVKTKNVTPIKVNTKMKNVIKEDKPEPYPMDAPVGYKTSHNSNSVFSLR